MNDFGWVSGVALANFDYSTGNSDGFHAFVWLGGGSSKTLPVPGYSYADSESNAHFITNDGTVIGQSGRTGGPGSATVWTCVQAQAYVTSSAAAVPNRAARHDVQGVRRHVTFRWLREHQLP